MVDISAYIWAKKRFRTRDLFSFHNTSWFDIFNIFLNPMTKVSFPITLILFHESNSHRTTFRKFQSHCGNTPTPVPQRSPRSSCCLSLLPSHTLTNGLEGTFFANLCLRYHTVNDVTQQFCNV